MANAAVGLTQDFTSRFTEVLSQLFPATRSLHDKEWHGGYCCLLDAETSLPHMLFAIGEAPLEKWPKYLALCQEKAIRLAQYPKHWSSAQSRDEDQGRYPGAIRTDLEKFCLLGPAGRARRGAHADRGGLPWRHRRGRCAGDRSHLGERHVRPGAEDRD